MDHKRAKLSTPGQWQPFPVDCLPSYLGDFTKTAASAIGCDHSFIGLPALVGCAGAIGNSRQIELKKSWTEPAVLWAGLVAESGELKSPAIDLATRHQRRRQAAEIENYRQAFEAYKTEKANFDEDLSQWRRAGRKEGRPEPIEPDQPKCRRLFVSDVTVEALADRLEDNPRGLVVLTDELTGWLGSFNQYKGGRGSDAAHWLTMFNARDLLLDRKDKHRPTIHAPRATVSIIGGIQPAILQRSLQQEYFDNGLAARLLLTMPPRSPKRWTEDDIDEQAAAELADIYDQLYSLQPAIDDNGKPYPVTVHLAPDGRREWIKFHDQHAQETAELSGPLAAAWSKIEAYAARLSLIHHLVRWAGCEPGWTDSRGIDAESMAAGIKLARWFANEARRVYSVFSESDEDREARELWQLMQRREGRLTPRDVMRSSSKYSTAPAAEAGLMQLVKRQLAARVVLEAGPQGGAPSIVFRSLFPTDIDRTPENTGPQEVLSMSTHKKNGQAVGASQ